MIGRFYPFSIWMSMIVASVAATVVAGLAGILVGLLADSAHTETDFSKNASLLAAVLFAAGVGYTVAGFVAARLSPGEEIFNAGASGACLLLLGIAGAGEFGWSTFPLWFDSFLVLFAFPLSVLGGRLYLRREPAASAAPRS